MKQTLKNLIQSNLWLDIEKTFLKLYPDQINSISDLQGFDEEVILDELKMIESRMEDFEMMTNEEKNANDISIEERDDLFNDDDEYYITYYLLVLK